MGVEKTPQLRSERIPTSLQQVFLQSNRGRKVNKPPPNSAASRVFEENWAHQRTSATIVSSSSKRAPPAKSSVRKQTVSGSSRTGRERSRRSPTKRQRSLTGLSPQQYLDALLEKRGYKEKTFRTLNTAYFNAATPWQLASYGPHMVELVRQGDLDTLRDCLEGGLSPNPCNLFGESLIHLICRRGDADLLKVMIDNGASVQVSDDFGRTPLHDACWAPEPAFDVVELLLELDPRLFFMKDKRGALPLSYVTRDHWYLWREFLERAVDVYYQRSMASQWSVMGSSELCMLPPNSRPLLEANAHKLPLELVSMVASGRMSITEATYMASSGAWNRIKNNPNSALDDSEYDDSDDDDDCSDSDESDLDDGSEMSSDDDLDDFKIQDQVSSMMDMVRAWDKKW